MFGLKFAEETLLPLNFKPKFSLQSDSTDIQLRNFQIYFGTNICELLTKKPNICYLEPICIANLKLAP
jgi:hypothetical protein